MHVCMTCFSTHLNKYQVYTAMKWGGWLGGGGGPWGGGRVRVGAVGGEDTLSQKTDNNGGIQSCFVR